MMGLWAAALLLSPVLAEDGDVRVVATGTGGEETAWVLDGLEVARTGNQAPATIRLTAGAHELWAVSDADGAWTAMARPEPKPGDGAVYVPAWTAVHGPDAVAHRNGDGAMWLAAGLGVAGVALLLPRRRSKSP